MLIMYVNGDLQHASAIVIVFVLEVFLHGILTAETYRKSYVWTRGCALFHVRTAAIPD